MIAFDHVNEAYLFGIIFHRNLAEIILYRNFETKRDR